MLHMPHDELPGKHAEGCPANRHSCGIEGCDGGAP